MNEHRKKKVTHDFNRGTMKTNNGMNHFNGLQKSQRRRETQRKTFVNLGELGG